MAEYRSRIVDAELRRRLGTSGAVLLEGPKACGKTMTARQAAASEVLLDVDANARTAASVAPHLVLNGATPRLIDEWQVEPSLWNHVRRGVDDRQLPGQWILTGSSVPSEDERRHTGTLRITRIMMRPMSLFESGHSSGAISLAALLDGRQQASPDPGLTLSDVAERLAIGGWPSLQSLSPPAALRGGRDYLEEVRRTDIHRIDDRRRDPERVGRLLTSLARNVATPVTLSALAADTGGADGPIKDDTAREYLTALGRMFVVEDQPAWTPHLRSRSIVRSAVKRHFVDPSLAVAAVRATPERLMQDLEWLGCLFESLVVRDLRIYAQESDAVVKHYRDNSGLEVDAIVERGDGAWAAFEVKLGQRSVDQAAASLLAFRERVDTTRCGAPSTLGVIVATGYGYVRDDGVAVLPLGALAP